MIQRKQTLWLFLASLLSAGVFFFDLYRAEIRIDALTEHKILRVTDHFPSLLISLVMVILPLVTIFMFNNRKRQVRLAAISLLSVTSFITLTLFRVTGLDKLVPQATGGFYWIGAVLPVLSIVFLVMAIVGIRKDEKLVRSVDRLR